MVVKTDQHQVQFVAAENLPEVFWKRFTVFAKGSKTSSRFSFLTCILQVNVTSIKVVETLNLREAKTQRGLNKHFRRVVLQVSLVCVTVAFFCSSLPTGLFMNAY